MKKIIKIDRLVLKTQVGFYEKREVLNKIATNAYRSLNSDHHIKKRKLLYA